MWSKKRRRDGNQRITELEDEPMALDTIKSLLYFDCDDHSKAVIMSFSLTCRVVYRRARLTALVA
jgi:hypothetical protein